ncbi:S-adenosyl-L-methionine-dependent methyltransferase [Coniochaeta ligniaria NRRL 30616]|uniref:S-adenosyl-L-methionine-dependent methyltransferase n=1 Tax=Coniochaeta ligniaria NRRL 30616 TaxID=1408157 RepID=A0A1J7IQ30_9PEZI|nr:S-adenosyl-L-methionine-dependent methyltransferase [Coniochaeta ligniaria NRRL 30616]
MATPEQPAEEVHMPPDDRPEERVRDDDQDSALGDDDVAQSTSSLASSILDYRKENGRTYHGYKDGKYNLPNDESERERLDLQHHLFLLTLEGKLGLAPPNDQDAKVNRVLDVGTGTGIWAMDYGDEHPDAEEVIGVDLSPIQPSFVPSNVFFQVDDVEEPWTYSKPFDYIHSRMMTSSLANWEEYFRNCYDNLAPGGWLELQEGDLFASSDDGTLKPEHALAKCLDYLHQASVKFGREYQDIKRFKGMMAAVGFVDIVEKTYKWPTHSWPKDKKHKDLGLWTYQNFGGGLESFCMAAYTRGLGWTKEEVLVFCAAVRRDMRDRNIHAYWPIYVIYGRKPEAQ